MTAIAISLAFVACLAFAAFVMTQRQRGQDIARLESRVLQLEQAAASPPTAPDISELKETVSTLALAAGLKARGSPRVS